MTSVKVTIDDTAVDGSTTRETHSTASTTTAAPTSSKTISKNIGSLSGGVLGVGVVMDVAVMVLIAKALILISVTVRLRQRKKKLLIPASNVAYHSASGQLSMTKETSAEEYDYVSIHSPHPQHQWRRCGHLNVASGMTLIEDMTENVVYGVGQNE